MIKNYITSSCVISDGIVFRDEKVLFENKNTPRQDFLVALYHRFDCQYPRFYKMDNLSKLGWLASEGLLKGAGLPARYLPEETGIVLSNANSSLDTDLRYMETVKEIPSPSVFVYTLPNIMIGEICIRNTFKGENAFFLHESFDPDLIEEYVNPLVTNGICRACICGWVDLLGEEYKAALFLVEQDIIALEKGKTAPGLLFTAKNMDRIFQTLNA